MWAADFDESLATNLAQNCLEPLAVQVPHDLSPDGEERKETEEGSSKSSGHAKHAGVEHDDDAVMKILTSNHSFCGLTRNFWSRNERIHFRNVCTTSRSREDALPVFCAAAILILNRYKIMKETHSIDDLIKVVNLK